MDASPSTPVSVGELAAHIAYGEATCFFGEDYDSPLVVAAARYYSSNVEAPFTLPIGAQAMYEEIKRIHAACKESYLANPHDSEEPNPLRGESWGWTLEYQAFHFAYHTGQIYSVRHMLGHETVDN